MTFDATAALLVVSLGVLAIVALHVFGGASERHVRKRTRRAIASLGAQKDRDATDPT